MVPKHDAYTEKGWLYGVKEGHYGLFPSDFVERLSPQAVRREMKVIAKVTAASARDGRATFRPISRLTPKGHLLLLPLQCKFCFQLGHQPEQSFHRNASAQPRAKGNSEESEDDVSDDTFDEEDFGRPDDEDLIDDHHVRTSAGAVRGQQRQQHR